MPSTNTIIHIISASVVCLSIVILGLVAHGVTLKDQLQYAATPNLKSVGMSILFWPAIGGIVDYCLFTFLWFLTPFQIDRVSVLYHPTKKVWVNRIANDRNRVRRNPTISMLSSLLPPFTFYDHSSSSSIPLSNMMWRTGRVDYRILEGIRLRIRSVRNYELHGIYWFHCLCWVSPFWCLWLCKGLGNGEQRVSCREQSPWVNRNLELWMCKCDGINVYV